MSTEPDPEAPEPRPGLSRRSLLLGAAGFGAAVGGLASAGILLARGPGPAPSPSSTTGSTPAPQATPTPTPVPTTVDSLLTQRPFRVAHRGGSDDWPEMSAYAYEQAIAHGYR